MTAPIIEYTLALAFCRFRGLAREDGRYRRVVTREEEVYCIDVCHRRTAVLDA
jgi:hypothetical protein